MQDGLQGPRASRHLRCRADLLPAADRAVEYYLHAGRRSDPEQWLARARRDVETKAFIRAV